MQRRGPGVAGASPRSAALSLEVLGGQPPAGPEAGQPQHRAPERRVGPRRGEHDSPLLTLEDQRHRVGHARDEGPDSRPPGDGLPQRFRVVHAAAARHDRVAHLAAPPPVVDGHRRAAGDLVAARAERPPAQAGEIRKSDRVDRPVEDARHSVERLRRALLRQARSQRRDLRHGRHSQLPFPAEPPRGGDDEPERAQGEQPQRQRPQPALTAPRPRVLRCMAVRHHAGLWAVAVAAATGHQASTRRPRLPGGDAYSSSGSTAITPSRSSSSSSGSPPTSSAASSSSGPPPKLSASSSSSADVVPAAGSSPRSSSAPPAPGSTLPRAAPLPAVSGGRPEPSTPVIPAPSGSSTPAAGAAVAASVSTTRATADTMSSSRRFITRTPWAARP